MVSCIQLVKLQVVWYFQVVTKLQEIGINVEINNLTNSVENVVTADSFSTDISFVSIADLKQVSKKTIGNLIGNLNLHSRKEIFRAGCLM